MFDSASVGWKESGVMLIQGALSTGCGFECECLWFRQDLRALVDCDFNTFSYLEILII